MVIISAAFKSVLIYPRCSLEPKNILWGLCPPETLTEGLTAPLRPPSSIEVCYDCISANYVYSWDHICWKYLMKTQSKHCFVVQNDCSPVFFTWKKKVYNIFATCSPLDLVFLWTFLGTNFDYEVLIFWSRCCYF